MWFRASSFAAGQFWNRKFRERSIGWKFLLDTALTACVAGAVVLTSTNAEAQSALYNAKVPSALYIALYTEAENVIKAPNCFDEDFISNIESKINHYYIDYIDYIDSYKQRSLDTLILDSPEKNLPSA